MLERNDRSEKDYMLTDVVEIHFLEYPKFKRLHQKNYKENAIERWLAFLQNDVSENTLKELMNMEPAIKKAENKLEYLSSDDETISLKTGLPLEQIKQFRSEAINNLDN